MFLVKRLNENAKVPTRGSDSAAGFDLYACEDIEIVNQTVVKTGISLAINPDTLQQYKSQGLGIYFRVAPRSGLAVKGIDVLAGVVDSDYRGEVGVILINHNIRTLSLKKGDRIAQLIPTIYALGEMVEVDDLNTTARGTGGFGSTGMQ